MNSQLVNKPICIVFLIIFTKLTAALSSLQTGFNLHLRNVQRIKKENLTIIGPWETESKAGLGDFLSGVSFDPLQTTAIIPKSGIYFVSVKIQISGGVDRAEFFVRSSLSNRRISALADKNRVGKENDTFFSGSIHLSIGEELQVCTQFSTIDIEIDKGSIFSLHLKGEYGLLPSFLASPARSERYRAKHKFRIASWKVHHKSTTSFSSALGTFVAPKSGNYLCNLNLLLEKVHGMLRVEFRTDRRLLYSLEDYFIEETSTAVYFSKIFVLNQKDALSLWLKPFNDSIIVSSLSSYSCVFVGLREHSIQLGLKNPTIIKSPFNSWKEVAFWSMKEKNGKFVFLGDEGKIFIHESTALVSLSLTVLTRTSATLSAAVLSGGVAERILKSDGIIRGLKLQNRTKNMLTVTGMLKVSGDSYISVFLNFSSSVKIIAAKLKVMLQKPLDPSIRALLVESGLKTANQTKDTWNILSIREHVDFKPQKQVWQVASNYFSPKKSGIYYLTVNVSIVIAKNVSKNALIEAKLARGSAGQTLVYHARGIGGRSNSLSLISSIMLSAGDRLSILYRCDRHVQCMAAISSGISAIKIANAFLVEGFSTSLTSAKAISFKKEYVIDNWKTSGSNFMMTKFFNADGQYKAAHKGIYVVTGSVSIRNVSINSDGEIKLQIKTGDESKQFIEDVSQHRIRYVEGDEGFMLSIATSLELEKDQSVSLRLLRDSNTLMQCEVTSMTTFSIVAITQPGLPPPVGFTMSLMNEVFGRGGSGQVLQRWTTNANGAFSQKQRSLYQFLEQQGTISVYKEAILMLIVTARVNSKAGTQHFKLQVNINDNQNVITSVDDSRKSTIKASVILLVQANQRLSVKVYGSQPYAVSRSTVISAVFLPATPSKPGLMLSIESYRLSFWKEWRVYHFKFCSNEVGYYKQNINYIEEKGSFEIPFSGSYLISLSLKIDRNSSNSPISCGLMLKTDTRLILLTSVNSYSDSRQLVISRVLTVEKPSSVVFACKSNQPAMTVVRNSYATISSLEYSREDLTGQVKNTSRWTTEKRTVRNAIYKLKDSGFYLLAVRSKRQLSALVLYHGKRSIMEISSNIAMSANAVYFALRLKPDSTVILQWSDKSKQNTLEGVTFYSIGDREGGLSLSISQDQVIHSNNKSLALIENWANRMEEDFMSLRNSYFESGLFISKDDGKYLVTVVLNLAAAAKKFRTVYLAIEGSYSPKAPHVSVCQTDSKETCTLTMTAVLHLQKWQSLGVYVHFGSVGDEIKVLKSSRLSVLLLDASAGLYEDDGPNVVSQPWPRYVNESKIFNWSCNAVGEAELDYSWKRTSLETNTERMVTKGRTVTILGRPEESGFYFCSVNMNGTIHNSQVATVNISDTDECTTNKTEFKHSCHKNADCINTVGSYYCECKAGYEGDGFRICSDIDECLVNTSCHAKAECENTVGSFKCQCNRGYEGDGKVCQDINECLGPNLCHKDSFCSNTNGSYFCVCNQGYKGSGYSCENINECLLDDSEYPCHEKASCADSIGSYSCKCLTGWTGNGTNCEDINECLTTNCTGNATCYNSEGSFRCKCNQGFRGDPFTHCESLGCTPPKFCSGEFKAAWWARNPYLANSSSQEPVGLFKDLLKKVVTKCCHNCSLLSFHGPYNGSFDVESAMEANTTVDFGCPLYGSPDQTLFRGLPFMPVVEAPGIAFFVKDQPKEKSAILGSLGSSWPILAITFLLACLSGIIIWFLDTVRNPTEFPNSFIGGSWEGFWWAFITMTTVGYGDKAPRSFGARLFGIVWILIGLVIISTFTATITTMLTASSLSDEIKLYGMKVGVLHNSEEYRLAVKRNAEAKSFGSVAEIVKNIRNGTIQGILLDAYIAGEYQDQLRDLRLHQVIDYVFSYGVVLSRDGLALKDCFNHFLESQQSQIYATISKVIKPLKQTKASGSLAAQKSASIFDSESTQFKYTLYGGLGLFGFLFIIGIIWEYLNSQSRRRRYSIAETEEPKEAELMEWKVQWDSGKVSHFHRNIFKNEISDLKLHIKEFAESWISRLDELESRQAREVNMMKHSNSKGNQEKLKSYRVGKISMKCANDNKHDQNHIEMMPK